MRIVFIVIFSFLLSSCDSGELWRDGSYEVRWLDLSENRSLGYVLGDGFWISKVDRKIMAIGSNELHIVVKRMDDKSNTTQYYYIVKSEDEGQSHLSPAIKGPYSLEEFNAINQSIKLPSFTSEFQ